MTIMTNCMSYTQDAVERMLAKSFQFPYERIKFEINYGCGEFREEYQKRKVDWTSLKNELFIEYDELWKELANR